MTEALQKELTSIIEKSSQKGFELVEFIQKQAPEVCNQYLNWYFWDHIFNIGIGVLLFVLAISLTIFIVKMWNRPIFEDYDNPLGVIFILFSIASYISGIVVILVNLYYVFYVSVAPKVILLDYIISVVK